jgi:hypothetical protein
LLIHIDDPAGLEIFRDIGHVWLMALRSRGKPVSTARS